MEVLLGGILCVALSVVTAILGLAAIDPQGVHRRQADAQKAPPRMIAQGGPAFAPLDLGPVATAWPSQRPWPRSRLPVQPWPSETWPDNFFGRKGNVFSSPKTATAQEAADEWFRSDAEEPPVETAARQMRPPQSQAPAEPQLLQPKPQAQAKPKPKPKPQPKTPPVPAPEAGGAITPQEVVALVERHGLAGAVDEVRKRTGWDFQRAAQFLAQTLRDVREGRR